MAERLAIYRRLIGAQVRGQASYRASFLLDLGGQLVAPVIDVLAILAMYAYGPRISGYSLPPQYAALHPFGMGTFVYAAFRSAYVALAKGGIEWRGTFYPLRVLKGDTRSG